MPNLLANEPRFRRTPVARGLSTRQAADIEDGDLEPIDRKGGVYRAGVVRGYAVITRGEAAGHEMWIDREFLSQVAGVLEEYHDESGREGAPSVKSRFTHPGLSSDGLGKFLGRTMNARLDGDTVRADLHLAESAHNTPSGDLASYVMDLAEEDPAAFGASIVFEYDDAAEGDFIQANLDGFQNFKSPDADNVKNLPHARLKRLRASDIVDSPAANPGGMFHSGEEIFEEAQGLAAFAIGLTDEFHAADVGALGIHPERLRGFVRRFLDHHGLAVRKKDGSMAASRKSPEPPAQAAAACRRYVDAFGDAGGRWFAEGLSFEAAYAKQIETLKAEHEDRIETLKAEHEDRVEASRTERARIQAEIETLKRIERARSYQLSDGVCRFAASIRFSSTTGE
jgi:hypothetical protein